MARQLKNIRLECVNCGHVAVAEAEKLEEFLGEALTFNTVSTTYKYFRCTECDKSSARMFDDTNRLLIDPESIAPCHVCHSPIIAPRLEVQPETNACAACAKEGAKPPVDPPCPQPPASQKNCPRCGNQTIVRQNSQDLYYFLGCTSFPKCRWTNNLEHQP